MPLFSSHTPPPSIKMLYLGHSGAGKTGSLVSLAAAGYRVRVLDTDNKADILRGFVTGDSQSNPKSIYLRPFPSLWDKPDPLSNISYVTITEGFNIAGVKAVPRGDSWQKINQQLNNWIDGDDKPGNISKWGGNDILVIDSFSRLCEAAMNYQLSLNMRLDKGPQAGNSSGNDYAATYKLITDFLNLLKSSDIKCHIILIGHIVFMEPGGQTNVGGRPPKGYTQVMGRAVISPTISQYFSHVLLAKSIGNEPNVKRTIVTNNDENVELITPSPLQVKREYPLETGLAEYFRDVRSVK